MKKFENTLKLENTALQLKALLLVMSATDTDNAAALAEMPHAIKIAAELAETLYCGIVEMEV